MKKTRKIEEAVLAKLRGRDSLAILGVDPGTRALGWGIVGRQEDRLVCIDHGVFRAEAQLSIGDRILFMYRCLERCINHHRPDALSLEEAFFHKNPQSALRLGEARGAVLLLAASRDIPLLQYPTSVAKKSVVGHGGASKTSVREMVGRELSLSLPPKEHDAADALALALCLLRDHRLHQSFA